MERDPVTCEHRIGNAAPAIANGSASEAEPPNPADLSAIGAPVLQRPTGTSSFPSSRAFGPDSVSKMMASRYVTVIGILGDPESGKTACLASLYLMISNAELAGWKFADSKTLMAFEDIARGAREWNAGNPPEQMTVHTELSDDRRPGFLHMRLVGDSDGRRVDLALPDLPGEWTTELVGTSRADRFEFLKAADVIWVVLDGRALANKERRQGVISRVGQLAGRLGTLVGGKMPKLVLVITHRDSGEPSAAVTTLLEAELAKRDLTATVIPVAPFSDDDKQVKSGFGIDELIEASTTSILPRVEFWPPSDPVEGMRSYVSYRRDR
ncbi:GTPase domain-containing protein [Neorhizobium sp. T25_27]|uniref:TRAFAC clade GTPase domain-containing protein n=1 Tax=Neorhizobium sp. T25_27 TaxID=2093831 RepID=UPI00197BE1A8|nr:GTPase domain-containing protein [Neorhizobium sp. T25_27]